MPTPLVTNHYLRQILRDLALKGLNFSPEDNVLNYHDRYTYHLQLVLVNDREAEEDDIDTKLLNNDVRYIVIAESGVTAGFNIVECEIKDAVSHNFKTKNAASVEVDMVIAEPYNMSLPDKMFESSRQIGVLNWRLAPIFLILWFDFYDADGNLVPSSQNTFYKVYKLNIVDLTNTLTAAGTIYRLKAAVNNNMGFKNTFYVLPQTYTITLGGGSQVRTVQNIGGVQLPGQGIINFDKTVGEFFQKLENELNDFYIGLRRSQQPQDQQTQVVVYQFFIADELKNQKIKFNPRINNRRASFRQVGDKIEIIAGRGISIGALVDDVCASIEDVRFFIPDDQSGIVRVPWIECVVKNIGWDYLRNDYIRNLQFFINVKETRRAVPSQDFGRIFQLINAFHDARLASINTDTSKLLKKAYLYFYTGNNTEIINLDVQFNTLHWIPTALTQNTVLPSSFSSARASLSELQQALNIRQQAQQQWDAVQQQLLALRGQRAGASLADIPALDQQIIALQQQLAQIEQQDAAAQRVLAQGSLVVFDPVMAESLENLYQPFGQLVAPVTDLRAQLERERTAAQRRRAPIEFTEDEFSVNNRSMPAQLTYISDPRDLVNTVRPQNTSDSDVRQMYSSVTQQIYARMQDMVNITMEIRGDPYWLGASNLERDRQLLSGIPGYRGAAGTPGTPATPVNDEFAVYQPYDAFFLLAFRAGTIPDETTGFMNLRDDVDFFNALYMMVQVTHIFKEGKFTQRCEATRDPLSNLGDSRTEIGTVPPVLRTGINQ
jgi:hypothetical protein